MGSHLDCLAWALVCQKILVVLDFQRILVVLAEMSSPVRQDLTGCPLHGQQEFFPPRSSPGRIDASDVPVLLTGFQPGFLPAVSTAGTP